MHLSLCNQSIIQSYGSTGQATVEKMVGALSTSGHSLLYDSTSKKFTVQSSTTPLEREKANEIFSNIFFTNWRPHLLHETDKSGNLQIELHHDDKRNFLNPLGNDFEHATHLAERLLKSAFESKNPLTGHGYSLCTREAHATELVSNITINLNVPLKGKECIDVGCRSGENMFAMQKAGAKVIGIDPVDTEFATARNLGLSDDQLIKATLQSFQSTNPNKFDIATVFLWCISLNERDSFTQSLARIIKPDGYVIIGFVDPVFNEGNLSIQRLMHKYFYVTEKLYFPDSLNSYMIKCSNPKTNSFI